MTNTNTIREGNLMTEELRSCLSFIAAKGNPYAKAYAEQALRADVLDKTQLLYVRSNISHLRGKGADMIKPIIDQYIAAL